MCFLRFLMAQRRVRHFQLPDRHTNAIDLKSHCKPRRWQPTVASLRQSSETATSAYYFDAFDNRERASVTQRFGELYALQKDLFRRRSAAAATTDTLNERYETHF